MSYSPDTTSILLWMGYTEHAPEDGINGDFQASSDGTNLTLAWFNTDPQDPFYPDGPTEQDILDNAKPWAASKKTEEIYTEQELRSKTVMGATAIPRDIFDFIEEFYTQILTNQSRNNITEVDTPKMWGLKQLRDNRNTLLSGLQTWVNDPAKTYQDILDFDVVGWSGWDIERP